MEALLGSSSSSSFLSPTLSKPSGFPVFRNGHLSFFPISSKRSSLGTSTRSLMVEAKKGNANNNKNKNNKKVDTHSFVPKPDEVTGPFPESILLKQKTVQEDGRVLPEFADDEEAQLFEYLNLQMESDLSVDQMRHYEVVYLIHEDHKDQVDEVNSKIQDFLREKKGKVWRFSDWGMRRLAYMIKKATHAHYILMNFELGTQWINEFKTMLDRDERVIRHLVMKRDEAITEDCPPPPEFHTLRADMTDEYEIDEEDDEDYEDYEDDDDDDDDEDYEEGDDEEYDEDADDEEYDEDERDLEGYEDDDVDVEDVSVRNDVRGTDNQKTTINNKGKAIQNVRR